MLEEDLTTALMNYLERFNKKRKRRGNYKDTSGNLNFPDRRAFVINDKNYIEKIKTVETICSDLDYKVIRLDELEMGKLNKLNKIAEATQSQRISSLPEGLSEKLKILETDSVQDCKKLYS